MAVAFETLMVKISADTRSLQKGLRTAGTGITKFGKGATARISAISTGLAQMSTRMLAFSAGAGLAIGGALKEFGQFEKGLANIAILLGEDKSAMEGITQAIRTIAVETGTATEQLTTGYFDIQSAVGDTTKAMDLFVASNDLAIAGGAEFGQTAKGLVTLMEAYGDSLRDAKDGADLMFKAQVFARASISEMAEATGRFLPTASKLGVSVEEVFGAFSKMTVSIGNANEASTAMTGVLVGLLKPTEELKKKSEEWFGISVQQVLKTGQFLQLMKKLGEVQEEELGLLLPRIQGLRGLLAVSEDYNRVVEISAELKSREGIVDAEKIGQLDTLARRTSISKEAFKDMLRVGVAPLAEKTKELADNITELLKGITASLEKYPRVTAFLSGTLGTVVLLTTALGLLGLAIKGLILMGGLALKAIFPLVVALQTGLATMIPLSAGLASATVAFGLLAIAIALTTGKLIEYANAWWNSKRAWDGAIESWENAEKAFLTYMKVVENAKKVYEDLTDEEKDRVISLERLIKSYEKLIEQEELDTDAIKRAQESIKKLGGIVAEITRKYQKEKEVIEEKFELETEYNRLRNKFEKELHELTTSSAKLKEEAFKKEINLRKQNIEQMNLQAEEQARLFAILDEQQQAYIDGLEEVDEKEEEHFADVMHGYFRIGKTAEQVFGTMPSVTEDTAVAMRDSFRTVFRDAFEGDLDGIEDYFKSFAKKVRGAFADMIADMVARWLWFGSITGQSGGGKVGGILGILGKVAGAFTGAGAVSELTDLSSVGTIASAGSASIASDFGPDAFAGVGESFGNIGSMDFPSFAKGTRSVPETGLAKVHKGEEIIPKDSPRNGGGGVTIVNLIDEKMIPAIISKYPEAVVNIISEDLLKSGKTRKIIKEV